MDHSSIIRRKRQGIEPEEIKFKNFLYLLNLYFRKLSSRTRFYMKRNVPVTRNKGIDNGYQHSFLIKRLDRYTSLKKQQYRKLYVTNPVFSFDILQLRIVSYYPLCSISVKAIYCLFPFASPLSSPPSCAHVGRWNSFPSVQMGLFLSGTSCHHARRFPVSRRGG